MGACVVTLDTGPTHSVDHQRRVTGTLHLSTSYASGGDTWTAANFGLGLVDDIVIDSGAWVFQPDITNKKIKAFTAAGTPGPTVALSEVSATTDLSATVVRFRAYGV